MNKIFVQIAAYRDPELPKTIESLLNNAKNPENLSIGIVRQYHEADMGLDDISKFEDDKRFKIINMHFSEAKGVCFARLKLQKLYNNEDYTLQLDSHHKFVKNWDVKLIEMFESLKKSGVQKPLLTTYLPAYTADIEPIEENSVPTIMKFSKFAPGKVILMIPDFMKKWKERTLPYKARFISGHFVFTSGDFCTLIPYDDDYYFHGEEINLSIRAYLNGFEFYHPHKVIAWHEYTRKGRAKHWEDDKTWVDMDNKAKIKNIKFLEDLETNNPKLNKTLQDYENYVGIKFSTEQVRLDTLLGLEPDENKPQGVFMEKKQIKLNESLENEKELLKELELFKISFLTQGNEPIADHVSSPEEVQNLIKTGTLSLTKDFYADKTPEIAIIWLYTKTLGWAKAIKFTL